MWQFDNATVPQISTMLPGPKAEALLERDVDQQQRQRAMDSGQPPRPGSRTEP